MTDLGESNRQRPTVGDYRQSVLRLNDFHSLDEGRSIHDGVKSVSFTLHTLSIIISKPLTRACQIPMSPKREHTGRKPVAGVRSRGESRSGRRLFASTSTRQRPSARFVLPSTVMPRPRPRPREIRWEYHLELKPFLLTWASSRMHFCSAAGKMFP